MQIHIYRSAHKAFVGVCICVCLCVHNQFVFDDHRNDAFERIEMAAKKDEEVKKNASAETEIWAFWRRRLFYGLAAPSIKYKYDEQTHIANVLERD